MKEIITYRLSGVGVWHYEFCLNGEPFGSVVSRVSRSEPARIEGPGISWYSRFDIMLVEICDDFAVLSGIEMIQSGDGSQCMGMHRDPEIRGRSQ